MQIVSMTLSKPRNAQTPRNAPETTPAYTLDTQVGYLLRRATQRHLTIFAENIPDLTPTQFAALCKLDEYGAASQNELGRKTSMDATTIKGVVDRLRQRGLVLSTPDGNDKRRIVVEITALGRATYTQYIAAALKISEQTLAPLSKAERAIFIALLAKLT